MGMWTPQTRGDALLGSSALGGSKGTGQEQFTDRNSDPVVIAATSSHAQIAMAIVRLCAA